MAKSKDMIGDNSGKEEKKRRVLFGYYHRKDREIVQKIRGLNEQKKENRKNANASGFTSQKLDHYLKAFEAEDQQKAVDRLNSDRENLRWLGLIKDDPNGDLLSDRASDEQMIHAKGFHAGLTGLDGVSGYSAGSVEDKTWLEAYHAGRKEYETEIPDILARIEDKASKEAPPDGDDPFAKGK